MRSVWFVLSMMAIGEAVACSATDLAWLTGRWVYTRGDRITEEQWLAPAGGVLLAMSRTVRGDVLREFEFIRIAPHEGKLAYLAMPNARAPATAFTAIECTAERVVFENPAHDFPTRIIYTRAGPDALLARIEGPRDGKTVGSEWRYTRVP